ncbi:phosphatidylglycerophosphatase A family protein [Reinekea marinisedimentorum]|uniref:Phosphatidylglycerophosphatase A n=1 Tax=Reinekea marinisedimentorum TaxID=230495 RepID=A0A4R3I2X1_9GAMM|nr:phosphatidylglycerophosphatase A [Reinekea marinisedimentorum]TCS38249.1 phosphatidylglycerophosphatase A [Reinekea marinisedimentorum]
MSEPSQRRWNNHWVHFLAFGFGSGAAPKAPGTFGTLAAIPVYLLLAQLPLWPYLAVIVLSFLLGVYLCGQTSKDMGVHDHGGIVWDEFVGYWITMIALPFHWAWIVAGFVLFRLFDILKPFPIGWLDKRVHGGLGIMIDDVIAGIFALIILQLARYFFF